jgi:broad specificity phosphatase PhoE
MTVRILFETHSTSTDNEAGIASGWLDPSLSETGRQQAIELGRRNDAVDVVYASDLKRAVDTAEIAFGPGTFKTDHRLRELDYGSMNGLSPDVIDAERRRRIDVAFPDGESIRDAIARVRAFLDDVAREHDGQTVLVIGHRATQTAFEHLLRGVALEETFEGYGWQPGWAYELHA